MAVVKTTSRSLPIFVVDAFTSDAFHGNPAAVCLVPADEPLDEDTMLHIAAEMNLSETAFVRKLDDRDTFDKSSRFGLRWFTPTKEVPLCGHATMASSAVLFFVLGNPSCELSFVTEHSGTLSAKRNGSMITLNLPLNKTEKQNLSEFEDLIKVAVDLSLIQDLEYSAGPRKLLVRLKDTVLRSELEALKPDIAGMLSRETTGKVMGVILTLLGSIENGAVDGNGRQYDFISRYFAPWVGIPEDPVTGVAHTVLASYWSREQNKQDLYARQCSKRGGDLSLHVREDRVEISGHAVVVVRGTLDI